MIPSFKRYFIFVDQVDEIEWNFELKVRGMNLFEKGGESNRTCDIWLGIENSRQFTRLDRYIYTRTVGKKDRQPTTSTRLVSYSIQTANRYDSHAINPTMTVNTLEKE